MEPRIVTAEHLMQLARDRRSVVDVFDCSTNPRPMPAAFLVNMPFAQVMRQLDGRLKVYEAKKPVALRWWELDKNDNDPEKEQES